MASVSILSKTKSAFHDQDDASGAVSGAMGEVTLRRNGARPISFTGSEIASSSSFSAGQSLWYQIHLYKTNENSFIAAIQMGAQSGLEHSSYSAYTCSNLEELVNVLENYDAAHDISANIDLEGDISAAELALEAASLRLKIEEARRQYGEVVGEVLCKIDIE
jgi:hypothetical protein